MVNARKRTLVERPTVAEGGGKQMQVYAILVCNLVVVEYRIMNIVMEGGPTC